jgi:hypothetical protein
MSGEGSQIRGDGMTGNVETSLFQDAKDHHLGKWILKKWHENEVDSYGLETSTLSQDFMNNDKFHNQVTGKNKIYGTLISQGQGKSDELLIHPTWSPRVPNVHTPPPPQPHSFKSRSFSRAMNI